MYPPLLLSRVFFELYGRTHSVYDSYSKMMNDWALAYGLVSQTKRLELLSGETVVIGYYKFRGSFLRLDKDSILNFTNSNGLSKEQLKQMANSVILPITMIDCSADSTFRLKLRGLISQVKKNMLGVQLPHQAKH